MGKKFDPSHVDRIIAKMGQGNGETATYATKAYFSVTQSQRARKPRKRHLNEAICEELRKNPEATARELWMALSNYKAGDLRIKVKNDLMDWEYEGHPPSGGSLKFISFESKVSRLRKSLINR